MMKMYAAAFALIAYFAWHYLYIPETTIISVRIGQTFEQVVRASTFPVMTSSNIPTYDEVGFGATWVEEPAVIIQFSDPKHGFTLPPTTFAGISYMHNKVSTIATSPMLRKLTFGQAVAETKRLQSRFTAGGWQLDDGTSWFDFTPAGVEALHNNLRSIKHGYMKEVSLRVPEKYSMTFRLRCAARCDSRIGLDRYLIDIGIAQDFEFAIQSRKRRQQTQ